MDGIVYFLCFVIVWAVISFFGAWYLVRKNIKFLQIKRAKLLTFLLLFLLPFSYDIISSLYVNLTFSLYCAGNSGALKKVDANPSSFVVGSGDIDKLFAKDVQFVEWYIKDKYTRSYEISRDIPEGYYKAFLRPIGDEDCEAFDIVFPEPKVRKRKYSWIKSKSHDQCVAIVKVDRVNAKYKYGNISYTKKTPYGYSALVTDSFITDISTHEKVGLFRQMSVSWRTPFISNILEKSDYFVGGHKNKCGNKGQLSKRWQYLFQNNDGDE